MSKRIFAYSFPHPFVLTAYFLFYKTSQYAYNMPPAA